MKCQQCETQIRVCLSQVCDNSWYKDFAELWTPMVCVENTQNVGWDLAVGHRALMLASVCEFECLILCSSQGTCILNTVSGIQRVLYLISQGTPNNRSA